MSPAPRVLFSSRTPHHATPKGVYAELDAEFHFTLDPCPLGDSQIWDGVLQSWGGQRVFCNPPYGRGIDRWLAKAREAECAVFLLPARTDTAWWHDYALKADAIRFVRGRLCFGDGRSDQRAPFPSVILVYGAVAAWSIDADAGRLAKIVRSGFELGMNHDAQEAALDQLVELARGGGSGGTPTRPDAA